MAEALKAHQHMVHLDLSHNQFDDECCKVLGNGLSRNHVLMGLHMGGNQQVVDPRGFLQGADSCDKEAAVAQSHIFTRVMG